MHPFKWKSAGKYLYENRSDQYKNTFIHKISMLTHKAKLQFEWMNEALYYHIVHKALNTKCYYIKKNPCNCRDECVRNCIRCQVPLCNYTIRNDSV